MVYVTDVIKKQFYVLWKVQSDNKMQQHKDMITSHQLGKIDSEQQNDREKFITALCGWHQWIQFLTLAWIFPDSFFLFIYNFIQTKQI